MELQSQDQKWAATDSISIWRPAAVRVRVEISHTERRRVSLYCQPVKCACTPLWFLSKATEVEVPGVSRGSCLLKRTTRTGAYLSQSGCVGKHGQCGDDMAACRVFYLDGVIWCDMEQAILCCLWKQQSPFDIAPACKIESFPRPQSVKNSLFLKWYTAPYSLQKVTHITDILHTLEQFSTM